MSRWSDASGPPCGIIGYQHRRPLERSARGRGWRADYYGSLRPGRDGDRFRSKREVFGSRVIDIKASALDTKGGLCVTETIDVEKGGPARHLHHEQEECFYVVEGEYVIEVGEERYELGPGDCVLAPREVAHVWAHVGEGKGRLIGALQPAGRIEVFFEELAKLGSTPQREELSRAFSSHGMELVGAPLSIE